MLEETINQEKQIKKYIQENKKILDIKYNMLLNLKSGMKKLLKFRDQPIEFFNSINSDQLDILYFGIIDPDTNDKVQGILRSHIKKSSKEQCDKICELLKKDLGNLTEDDIDICEKIFYRIPDQNFQNFSKGFNTIQENLKKCQELQKNGKIQSLVRQQYLNQQNNTEKYIEDKILMNKGGEI